MSFINQHIDQVRDLCVSNKVKTLFAFGSVLTETFREDSDIDLVVDIDEKDPVSYTEKYFNLKFQLEDIFKRPVDLLELRAIKNRFLRTEIDKTKVQLYGA